MGCSTSDGRLRAHGVQVWFLATTKSQVPFLYSYAASTMSKDRLQCIFVLGSAMMLPAGKVMS